ncbi:MAG TPA: hypothetical protein PLY35_12555 [Thermotogota bacterium]|jgi:hypothetical protein|nr:hypothetical protein [Thermotogota bacterium]
MKISTLLRKANAALCKIESLNPEEIDREVFKMEIEKARAIAYLVRTVSEIIAKNEMEDRIAALENAILQEKAS